MALAAGGHFFGSEVTELNKAKKGRKKKREMRDNLGEALYKGFWRRRYRKM